MAWLALGHATGLAAALSGVLPPPAPLLLVLLAAPVALSLRPGSRLRRGADDSGGSGDPALRASGAPADGAAGRRRPGIAAGPGPRLRWAVPGLALAVAAGLHLGGRARATALGDCRLRIADEAPLRARGVFEGGPGVRGRTPFRVEGLRASPGAAVAGDGRCRGTVRVIVPDGVDRAVGPGGSDVVVSGRWLRRRRLGGAPAPERAGTLVADRVEVLPQGSGHAHPLVGLRLRIQGTLRGRLGEAAPLAEALLLARREALDPAVRERFARAGVAHLLAISGFHIAVVAGMVLSLLLAVGLRRPWAEGTAVAAVWAYVALIGAPHPALRAAVLVTAFGAARLLGRPVHPMGALGSAALVLVLASPRAVGDVGFQLSFAAAAGLVAWSGDLRRGMERTVEPALRALRRRGVPERVAAPGRLRPLGTAVAAGVAATVATAPLAAWHFGRVAPGGIVLTLLLAPAVAAAVPGLAALVVADALWPGAAAVLAGGLALLLEGVEAVAVWGSGLPGASVAVSRAGLGAAGAGLAVAATLLRLLPPLGGRARRAVVAAGVAAAVLAAPAVAGGGDGDLHLHVLDVGQGDAIALRSPRGRWLVVDAGPRREGWDAGARVVVPFLRRRGVRRVEALLLSHPDMDHLGGAEAVVAALEVGAILDPARAVARPAYVALLRAARSRGVRWVPAREGRRLDVDGVEVDVLHPPPGALDPSGGANELSAVLRIRYGRFTALLPGDAPASVEVRVSGAVGDRRLDVLKVAHHGSGTSTPWALLRRSRPRLAVISVGRRNRYGHPDPGVVARLRAAGARVVRTDEAGDVHVIASADGRFSVETGRDEER